MATPQTSGARLGDQFRIIEKLGHGGMGEVFLAEQVALSRRVVIKLVHRHLLAERPELAARIKREARIVAQMNHPHIVGLHLFAETEDGQPYLVMEFVDGRSLSSEIRQGPFAEGRALRIAAQICDALAEAHRQGVVHRDLKPDNIMLAVRPGDPDYVKVLDFGIAKLTGLEDGKLTQSGAFFGTPQYVAPEQVQGAPVDARTDIYGVGLILYEMLTARVLFGGATPFELLTHHVRTPAEAPSARRIGSSLSPRTDALVLRCLEKDPNARFASALALKAELEHAPGAPAAGGTQPLPRLPSTAPPPQLPPAPGKKRRRRWLKIGLPLLAVLWIGGGVAERLTQKQPAVYPYPLPGQGPPPTAEALAAGDLAAYVMCLNATAPRAYACLDGYLAWVDRRTGPTGQERKVGGVENIASTDYCDRALAGISPTSMADPEMYRLTRAYRDALDALDRKLSTAKSYYDHREYREDAFARGKLLHGPLMEHFDRYRALEGQLRARARAAIDEQDARLRADRTSGPIFSLVHRLRLDARAAVQTVAVPRGDRSAFDAAKYGAAVQAYSWTLSSLEEAASDVAATDPLRRMIDYAHTLKIGLRAASRYFDRSPDGRRRRHRPEDESSYPGRPSRVLDAWWTLVGQLVSLPQARTPSHGPVSELYLVDPP